MGAKKGAKGAVVRPSPKDPDDVVGVNGSASVRAMIEEMDCIQCGGFMGDDNCAGEPCRLAFRRMVAREVTSRVEIRRDPAFGYGIFTQPRKPPKKDDMLKVYMGELMPPYMPTESRYNYSLASGDLADVDAEKTGNWTRFVNSHCRANVDATTQVLGGQVVILFNAKKRIAGNKQVFVNYGRQYFLGLGMQCRCSTLGGTPHHPRK
ncbi:Uu.00g142350.m01.CDS01 [Anthostomella pinea]|uniref:Uu.00g142350.m01.CDS01 n=1 Tax=Anthostomella pinea TaxID=933095 RepID=A0AAI8VR94_9PEZI|nr:Uu.00g142350.m01.CDS01 [Anthostomella pinea]